jgi:hypothetical protein
MTDGDDWADFIEFLGRAPAALHPGVLFEASAATSWRGACPKTKPPNGCGR